jgi:hypothetical protein
MSAYPLTAAEQQTSLNRRLGQRTKSLRSSPLRGSKSRQPVERTAVAGWQGQRDQLMYIGVQRMIKDSNDYLAGRHPDAAVG